MKRLTVLFVLLAAVVAGESYYVSVSATTAASTSRFPRQVATVLACNDGAGVAYARVFNANETVADATAASSAIPVGGCLSWTKPPTDSAYYVAISLLSASTSTVRVYAN